MKRLLMKRSKERTQQERKNAETMFRKQLKSRPMKKNQKEDEEKKSSSAKNDEDTKLKDEDKKSNDMDVDEGEKSETPKSSKKKKSSRASRSPSPAARRSDAKVAENPVPARTSSTEKNQKSSAAKEEGPEETADRSIKSGALKSEKSDNSVDSSAKPEPANGKGASDTQPKKGAATAMEEKEPAKAVGYSTPSSSEDPIKKKMKGSTEAAPPTKQELASPATSGVLKETKNRNTIERDEENVIVGEPLTQEEKFEEAHAWAIRDLVRKVSESEWVSDQVKSWFTLKRVWRLQSVEEAEKKARGNFLPISFPTASDEDRAIYYAVTGRRAKMRRLVKLRRETETPLLMKKGLFDMCGAFNHLMDEVMPDIRAKAESTGMPLVEAAKHRLSLLMENPVMAAPAVQAPITGIDPPPLEPGAARGGRSATGKRKRGTQTSRAIALQQEQLRQRRQQHKHQQQQELQQESDLQERLARQQLSEMQQQQQQLQQHQLQQQQQQHQQQQQQQKQQQQKDHERMQMGQAQSQADGRAQGSTTRGQRFKQQAMTKEKPIPSKSQLPKPKSPNSQHQQDSRSASPAQQVHQQQFDSRKSANQRGMQEPPLKVERSSAQQQKQSPAQQQQSKQSQQLPKDVKQSGKDRQQQQQQQQSGGRWTPSLVDFLFVA
mmetsp:Transcript_7646/g.13544  ORF Transcript_7646/g.13544 Transcript_7646/m.13544 type:complete len:662 (-) Transcript_7646:754-2739(-)